jgi:predicted transcriptional regulator
MATATREDAPARLVLRAKTAADLMSGNPVSIRHNATIQEAVALLTDKGFSAAAVIDDAGRPVGVLSRTDVLIHDREKASHNGAVDDLEPTRVADIMTPAVFSVALDTPVRRVIDEMLGLNVQQLFVVDKDGIVVGMIAALDVLRHLQ